MSVIITNLLKSTRMELTRGVGVKKGNRNEVFIQLAAGDRNWPQYKQILLLFSPSFIGHILTKVKICHKRVYVLNFSVTFL